MAEPTAYLGIDIGGSGIKGAPVDIDSGALIADRHRIATPNPATPEAVAEVVAEIVRHFDYRGPIGITFPSVVLDGVTLTAANVDDGWIGCDAAALFAEATGQPVFVLNDADAAGVAEMTFGAGRGRQGTVFVLTFGTGIGSALFTRGELVANTELGHIELDGREAEPWASDRARSSKGLSWKGWGKRVDRYLLYLEGLFWPELFIIGGGVSKKSDKFFPRLTTRAPVVAAELLNEAGIVGAALIASRRLEPSAAPSGGRKTATPKRTGSVSSRGRKATASAGEGGATGKAPRAEASATKTETG